MKNPYKILKIKQNATKQQIYKAFISAQKENSKNKKYSGKELMEAWKQLMNPKKRLVADFMFPSKPRSKRPRLIKVDIEVDNSITIDSIDPDAFDSLKYCEEYE